MDSSKSYKLKLFIFVPSVMAGFMLLCFSVSWNAFVPDGYHFFYVFLLLLVVSQITYFLLQWCAQKSVCYHFLAGLFSVFILVLSWGHILFFFIFYKLPIADAAIVSAIIIGLTSFIYFFKLHRVDYEATTKDFYKNSNTIDKKNWTMCFDNTNHKKSGMKIHYKVGKYEKYISKFISNKIATPVIMLAPVLLGIGYVFIRDHSSDIRFYILAISGYFVSLIFLLYGINPAIVILRIICQEEKKAGKRFKVI